MKSKDYLIVLILGCLIFLTAKYLINKNSNNILISTSPKPNNIEHLITNNLISREFNTNAKTTNIIHQNGLEVGKNWYQKK